MPYADKLGGTITRERSTGGRVYETLKDAIINKKLDLGERLVEAKIAKALQVSITPVRHAFTQLQKEGLINVFPFKGTYVVEITGELIEELKLSRLLVEKKAAELFFENKLEGDLRILNSYIDTSEKLFNVHGDIYDIIKNDIAFHELFFLRSGKRILLEMWNILKSRIMLLQSYSKGRNYKQFRMRERHDPILSAIEKNNKQLFLKSIEDHINISYRVEEFEFKIS